eukprot:scaffold37760_cov72-Phaeocystis_antarctica.AAC.2
MGLQWRKLSESPSKTCTRYALYLSPFFAFRRSKPLNAYTEDLVEHVEGVRRGARFLVRCALARRVTKREELATHCRFAVHGLAQRLEEGASSTRCAMGLPRWLAVGRGGSGQPGGSALKPGRHGRRVAHGLAALAASRTFPRHGSHLAVQRRATRVRLQQPQPQRVVARQAVRGRGEQSRLSPTERPRHARARAAGRGLRHVGAVASIVREPRGEREADSSRDGRHRVRVLGARGEEQQRAAARQHGAVGVRVMEGEGAALELDARVAKVQPAAHARRHSSARSTCPKPTKTHPQSSTRSPAPTAPHPQPRTRSPAPAARTHSPPQPATRTQPSAGTQGMRHAGEAHSAETSTAGAVPRASCTWELEAAASVTSVGPQWPHRSLPLGFERLGGSSRVRSAAKTLESQPREARAVSCGTRSTTLGPCCPTAPRVRPPAGRRGG